MITPTPVLEEVSENIWAYVQPDGSWFLNNAAFLVGQSGAVLVDTTSTERRTRALLEAVAGVTSAPVRTLVNTHSHGDHTFGNYQLPLATIVGHTGCRASMLEAGLGATAMFPDVDWGELKVEPPFVTFDDRLTLWVDDLEVNLAHVGPAHTTNDVFGWIPERKVLLAGDLVFNGGTPFVMMGSVSGSLEAIATLRALDPAMIVPGHGPVASGTGVLDAIEAYFHFVQETARTGIDAGLTPLEAAREADLGPFAEWGESERLAPNLHRAYAEAHGGPPGADLDLAPLLADMLALAGGHLPHCLA